MAHVLHICVAYVHGVSSSLRLSSVMVWGVPSWISIWICCCCCQSVTHKAGVEQLHCFGYQLCTTANWKHYCSSGMQHTPNMIPASYKGSSQPATDDNSSNRTHPLLLVPLHHQTWASLGNNTTVDSITTAGNSNNWVSSNTTCIGQCRRCLHIS